MTREQRLAKLEAERWAAYDAYLDAMTDAELDDHIQELDARALREGRTPADLASLKARLDAMTDEELLAYSAGRP